MSKDFKLLSLPEEKDIKLKGTLKVEAKSETKAAEVVKNLGLKEKEDYLCDGDNVTFFIVNKVNIGKFSKDESLGSCDGNKEIENKKLVFYTAGSDKDITEFVDSSKKTTFKLKNDSYCTKLYYRGLIENIGGQDVEKETKLILNKWSTKALIGIFTLATLLISLAFFAVYYFFIRNPEEETEEEINEEGEVTHL